MVEMIDWEREDSLTRLNTQLNKSMVLIENVTEDHSQQNKSNKSIKINTTMNPRNVNNSTNGTRRKSILKKLESTNNEERNVDRNEMDIDLETVANRSPNMLAKNSSARPNNLQDLVQKETLTLESTSPSYDFDDISDNEDIWIMDIPKTIDPKELVGQTLVLGDKSKFKVGEEKYCAVNRTTKQNVTCVFNSGKVKSRYRAVNIKPLGSITIRKKLSSIPKVKPISLENTTVPFPEHLKMRHPLFGIISESKPKKESKMYASNNKKKK